ncbi:MAG: hypothetical protein AAGA63_13715 [Pseudomonadota bacterium]
MDPFTLTFYAVICGVLSLVAPNLGGWIPRIVVGAVVGVASATVLPWVRELIFAAF